MNQSVLIVDDSLTVRMDLLEAFESCGFHAIPCATAAEAWEALARTEVHVVVLDVLLPDTDGVEFLKELRACPDHEDKTVLMLSTEAEVSDRIRGLRTGADEYVGKPYDAGYVVAKARQLLHARRPPTGRVATILVIDDSLTFRMQMQATLETAGYAVITAATGEDGLRVAAGQRPAAVIVDGMLPGIDGATVIRRLRMDAGLRDVPCLLLTAAADRAGELRVLDAGADAFVRKEEDVDVVLAKLAAMLRQVDPTPIEEMGSLHGPKTILAVDDSATYLDAISVSLRSEGYEVVLAHSGEEAIELLAAQTVDCILLDLLMPGLDGRETCKRIKAAPAVRDIPLIMMTALDDREAMLTGLGDGADDYIQKSDELEILKARVRAQIRRKHFQDENRLIRDELLRKEMEATEARAARELAEARVRLVEELERKNRELETFSYSVAHDLRGPLMIIDAFSHEILEDYGAVLDGTAHDRIRGIRSATQRMADTISALLSLSHAGAAELSRALVDIAAVAREVVEELRRAYPERQVTVGIEERMLAEADRPLIGVLLENLLGNAWKFTSRTPAPVIEVGSRHGDGDVTYFVRDNGPGFDPTKAAALFRPFTRLHSQSEYPGTGIGLATVHRIVDRHGGRVWAESEPGRGATFYFTIQR